MSCERYGRALALHVEGDLPAAEAADVQQHLEHCAPCRELLARLQQTQRTVRSLADEPLDEALLAEVRTRVVAAVARRPVTGPAASHYRWAWALAAALALASFAAVLLRHQPQAPPPATIRSATSLPQVSRSVPRPAATPTAGAWQSTIGGPAPVSPGVKRKPESRLSEQDGDQLARAVVAVSRVQRLSEPAVETDAAAPPTDLVRLETADPDVVIYWQLDSSGGQ